MINILICETTGRPDRDTTSQMCLCHALIANNEREGFEVFTAATMKNEVLWDVSKCGSRKKRSFEGMSPQTSEQKISASEEKSTLKMELTHFSKTSVLIRPIRHHIPEDDILRRMLNLLRIADMILDLVYKRPDC
jgi:hypothetical protein